MHIDANIEIIKDTNNRMLMAGTKLDIAFDFDYCDDFDDVIQAIEEKIFEDFNVSLTHNIDFTIINANDICEEFGY